MAKTIDRQEWLGLQEVAKRLGISHEAARRLVARGRLAHRRRRSSEFGGWVRIEVQAGAVEDLRNCEDYQARTRKGSSS